MKLFDAHCHLVDPEALERAADAGVTEIAVCGTNSNDWKSVLGLVPNLGKEKGAPMQLVPMIGIHPWFVNCRAGAVTPPETEARPAVEPCLQDFQTLEKLLRDFPNIGIGETGLDFSSFAKASEDKREKFTNRAEQEASFAAHLELAEKLNRPVAVHCVKAWGRLVEILREHPAPKKMIHAFSGAAELIDELTELNCWFSFCGNVTNPKAKRARVAAVAVPVERLLIETDAPDFPPVGTSAPNEPANLIHVAHAVAALRGVAVEEIAELTFNNARALFGLKA